MNNNKLNFKEILNNKRVRYGSYSTIMIVVVIAMMVVINLVVGKLNLKYDLTDDKMYTISNESIDIMKKLDQDVNIYYLAKTGRESETLTTTQILEQYVNHGNKHIKLQNKDPYIYPQFVAQFSKNNQEIPVNSIIVQGKDRFKVVNADDIISYSVDPQTYQQIPQTLDLEPQVTSAIQYVTSKEIPVVYVMTGHDEDAIPDSFVKHIELENYIKKDMNLLTGEDIPADTGLLVFTTPKKDYAPDEVKKIKAYLEKNGRALFIVDFLKQDFPNFNSILTAYGVSFNNLITVEGDAKYGVQTNPLILMPKIEQHDITAPLIASGRPVVLPMAQGINILDIRKKTLSFEKLLDTSDSSYAKTNKETQTIAKEAGDIKGPFSVAMAVTDTYYTDQNYKTKLILIGSSYILDDSMDASTSGSNSDFLLNAINWLHDKDDSIYIRPKSLQGKSLVMNGLQQLIIFVISIVILPLVIIISGFVVWLRRRNR